MEFKTTHLAAFQLIGIAVRTTNADGQSQKDIGELWERFLGGNLANQIPNKVSNDIYCVYTDYESDYRSAYTTLLGCKVRSLEFIPEGFSGKEIPETTYKHYQASGSLPECVGNAWYHIWQSGVERQYQADFDVYGEKAQNPQEAVVDIYVS